MAGEYCKCVCSILDTHVHMYICMCEGMCVCMCVCVLGLTYVFCTCCTDPAAISLACKLQQTTAKPTAQATTLQCSTCIANSRVHYLVWLLRTVGEACPPTRCSVYVCM